MTEARKSEISRVLRDIAADQPQAVDRLLPWVYDELRALATRYLADERCDHTLQPTALVHEAYLRLQDQGEGIAWQSEAHFRGIAARAMRQLLVDHARRKGAAKRGGDWNRITLAAVDSAGASRDVDLLSLNDTLERLAVLDEQMYRVVEMRFFAGMNHEEIACVLGVTSRTVQNKLSLARAWLSRELTVEGEN